jgi:hypothetical protein
LRRHHLVRSTRCETTEAHSPNRGVDPITRMRRHWALYTSGIVGLRLRRDRQGMQRYVEPPQAYTHVEPALFLAGGITQCPDWQTQAVCLLRQTGFNWVILNPRRRFPPTDSVAVAEQTAWEYQHLQIARAILFWFPGSPSSQPIALYELGACAAGNKPIAVGADQSYPRRNDIVLQLSHARPRLIVRDTLTSVVTDIVRLCT